MTPRPEPGTLARMFGIGFQELFIILVIVLLLFGARRLPEIGAGLGKAIKNFRSGVSGKDEIDVTPKKDEAPEATPPAGPPDSRG